MDETREDGTAGKLPEEERDYKDDDEHAEEYQNNDGISYTNDAEYGLGELGEHRNDNEEEEVDDGWEETREGITAEDWEKEAKRKVHIDVEIPTEAKRKTIYELDAYASSGPSASDILKLSRTDIDVEPPKNVRYSVSMGVPGIARINLSPLTQKIVGCVIGENVTTEYPWVYVRKEIIEDNIDLHSESSDFLPVKDEIESFPDTKLLIGYAPSMVEEGQFYICLTEEGRDGVMRHMQAQRQEHENRVRNAVYKPVGEWHDFGSGAEVDDALIKNTRPLFEIEVVSTTDLLSTPISLADRLDSDQRDAYIELLPYRQKFENVTRVLVDINMEVMTRTRDNEAQTTSSMPANSWFQYLYKYLPIEPSNLTAEETEGLKMFLRRYTERLCDEALMNTTWDMYENDYRTLVKNEKDTLPPVPISYLEHQSYYDGTLTVDKVINDLSWHPLWTGIAIAAYTRYSKSDRLVGPQNYDEVARAGKGNNKVLIWSFADCLSPKLVLVCPREVTAIATCPLNGNVIIGGCANGQIAIWDVPGKIEQTEAVVVRTTAQVKYRIAMKSLMAWMRSPTGSTIVWPAAMSSLQYSQKAAITQIIWVPSHHKVDKNGVIQTLPADTSYDDLNSQFVTASKDGTIAFWDLKWRPREKTQRQMTRRRRTVSRPDTLTRLVSPYKVLDRVFKPDYLLVCQYPNNSRRPVITTLSMYNPKFAKIQVEPFPLDKDDITIRRYYKPVIKKPDYVMKPQMLVGTIEGDFGCITWEGFEFATGVTVNREICKWIWIKRIHDGPITHSVRSKYLDNVVATVGGKVFAVWREDFHEPVIWKKSKTEYTACSWGTFRPTILILARMDGSVEIWDFIVKSYEPSFKQSLSGQIITGIYTHELYLNPQCVGFCDYHGTLRMFLAPRIFLTYDVSDIDWMKNFVNRQVQRISEFEDWQEKWNETNVKSIEMKKRLAEMEAEKKLAEMEVKVKAEMAKTMERLQAESLSTKRKPGQFMEEAMQRWTSMELTRMQHVILEKKGLRKEVLEKQRAPVMKLRQDAARKKSKIRQILQLQDKIFEETVTFLFPEQREQRKHLSLSPILAPTAEASLVIDDFRKKDAIPKKEGYFAGPEEEIVYDFLEIQAEVIGKMLADPIQHTFDWRKVLREGKLRRDSMDIELKRRNKQKTKRKQE